MEQVVGIEVGARVKVVDGPFKGARGVLEEIGQDEIARVAVAIIRVRPHVTIVVEPKHILPEPDEEVRA